MLLYEGAEALLFSDVPSSVTDVSKLNGQVDRDGKSVWQEGANSELSDLPSPQSSLDAARNLKVLGLLACNRLAARPAPENLFAAARLDQPAMPP